MASAVCPASAVYLGKYKAQKLLGEGGMGQVYLGRRLKDNQAVVIKVMHGQIAANPQFRQSFQREMELMTQFRHPNAVALYDASLDDPPCIVMEYVAGETLDAIVQKQGRLSVERVGKILGQLCPALYAAHSMEILHRDLTPANIMVSAAGTPRETIKVMDFGLARMGEGFYIPLEKLQGAGNSIGGGTPDFVPPEQIRGDAVDHRGDLYSVGVTLFKLLTGYLPFEQAQTVDDILTAHLKEKPPRFAALGVEDVPPRVETVVQTLLSKFPVERPADARQLAERYGEAIGHPIAPPTAFVTQAPKAAVVNRVDPRTAIDRLEAWMPEQIAVIKIRGFVDGVGGKIIDSQPGLIRVCLGDPDSPAPLKPQGFLSWLGLGKQQPSETTSLFLDLHMNKRQQGTRNVIEILVFFRTDQRGAKGIRHREHAERLCRDLRAYLIC